MASTKVTGFGGFVLRGAVVGSVSPFDQSVAFPVGAWDLDVQAIIPDATESDALGWADGLTGLYKMNSLMIEFIQRLEIAAIFELACCPIGGRVDLFLRKGSTGFGNQVNRTMLKGLKVTDRSDNGDPIKQVATFEFGIVSFNLALPATYTTP